MPIYPVNLPDHATTAGYCLRCSYDYGQFGLVRRIGKRPSGITTPCHSRAIGGCQSIRDDDQDAATQRYKPQYGDDGGHTDSEQQGSQFRSVDIHAQYSRTRNLQIPTHYDGIKHRFLPIS